MVQLKTNTTILSELRTFLKAYSRLLDTSSNSIINDFILTPLSIGGDLVFAELEKVKNMFLLSQQTSSDLELEATNYKLRRSTGTSATVNITFYSETAPSADVTISQGTRINSVGTTAFPSVVFITDSEYQIIAAAASSFYSFDRGRYEYTVPCTANTVGSSHNLGAETIVRLTGSIEGIDGVTNLLASSGGEDSESNEDLRQRIQKVKTGRDINTVNGLQLYIETLNFSGAYPIRVEDPDAERASGIDIFAIDSYSIAESESFVYRAGTPRHYFEKAPVRSVTAVSSAFSGALGSTQYSVNIDNTTQLRRSAYAQDYIEMTGLGIPDGDTITVVYTYAADVNQTQSTLELEENNVLTAEVLIKRAFPLYLRLNASLTLKSNADGPITRSRARNSIIQYLATFRLGDPIQKSDLVVVLQEGFGDYALTTVDAVTISSYYLEDEFGTTYAPVAETIEVTNKQYVVFGRAVLT